MKLIICEKNIAARRIAQILSYGKVDTKRIENIPIYEFIKDNEKWKIIGLRGHVLNLDFPAEFNYWRKISPRKLIDVDPYKKIIEKRIVTALNTLVVNSPFLIIATDYDREGELIGVEIINLLKKQHEHISQIKRAKFSAITPGEITTAFQELGEVDYNLSNAGEARQQIDLFWGAVLTRFISLTSNRLGKDFLSIGRVQSPTLAILVEREKEITNFQPQLYWRIIARLQKDKMFDAIYHEEQIWDEQQARRIYEKVKDCPKALVQDVQKERTNELPPSPFNTTTFLQAASSLGFSAEKAMNIAQKKRFHNLKEKVQYEIEKMNSQISQWKKLSSENISIGEKLEQLEMTEYLKKAIEITLTHSKK